MDPSCIQVAVYDDRLEVTSPGMLYGLTLEDVLHGRSKSRNKIIADVFNRMELIEAWGTGIRRILKSAEAYDLPTPEFMEFGDTFRVNLYRPTAIRPIKADKKPIKADKKPINDERRQIIFDYVKEYGSISNKQARSMLHLADSTTKRFLKQMVQEGWLKEQGENKSRIYILNA